MGRTREIIEKIALNEGHDYESLMIKFKSDGWGILECILFIKYNQDVDLAKAGELLFENKDWKPEEKSFRQHQIDIHEEALGYSASVSRRIKDYLSKWLN
jgi:hypothetical protein